MWERGERESFFPLVALDGSHESTHKRIVQGLTKSYLKSTHFINFMEIMHFKVISITWVLFSFLLVQ